MKIRTAYQEEFSYSQESDTMTFSVYIFHLLIRQCQLVFQQNQNYLLL